MKTKILPLPVRKRIALVAHDHMKPILLDWAREHREVLRRSELVATGTTGEMLQRELGLEVRKLASGPLGGDQQIGAGIVEGWVTMLIFFWDPLEPQPHDPDVKALLRLAVVWSIPLASNRTSADFLITSPYMEREYPRRVPDFSAHNARLDPKPE